MKHRHLWLPFAIALILYVSGACSLLYQTVWLREFRLILGGSTAAAAAVVAVFMGGLGLGGWWFGARVEQVRFPFRFYARLELAIAISAMLTPQLLQWAKDLYSATGGLLALGSTVGILVQIALTAGVLGIPCFLMGGTLPAAMKFAQQDADPHRSATALYYGINIAGAVTGAALGTFWLLEAAGNKGALTFAALANVLVGGFAWLLSYRCERPSSKTAAPADTVADPLLQHEEEQSRVAPVPFVLAAAFMSGFTYFVTELVWYRVSVPLLGGSVYGFGLVLCVALAGMGLGGLLYSLLLKRQAPTLTAFSVVSALQAMCILAPWALGDDLAFAALVGNEITRGFGFASLVSSWAVILAALAFLPSLLAGIQFPLLVSLLGRGNTGVGRELGQAYLANTFGSIAGSLLAGFVLIPGLGSTDCWRLMALLVACMSLASLALALRPGKGAAVTAALPWAPRLAAGSALLATLLMALMAEGPTAVWLHSPIGYGRIPQFARNQVALEKFKRHAQATTLVSYEGRETSVAVQSNSQYAMLTNGKSDGSALGDAPTQGMLGLLGALLHPAEVKTVCAVGLGTGSSAGWLAQIPSVERVDCIELEPEVTKVAEHFAPVSFNATEHPKVHLLAGDAREVLITHPATYDVIASEPSNPYRAGVANLYTQEFYASVAQRLNPQGVFCQWVQGYEIDADTIRIVMRTLRSQFAKVEAWTTLSADILFVASNDTQPWSYSQLSSRITQRPYALALARLWTTDSAEGVLAHCLANDAQVKRFAAGAPAVNTDDRNVLEFGFGQSVGRKLEAATFTLRANAYRSQGQLPTLKDGQPDPALLLQELLATGYYLNRDGSCQLPTHSSPELAQALKAHHAQARGQWAELLSTNAPLRTLHARWAQAEALARLGKPEALPALDALEALYPVDTTLLRALHATARKQPLEAAEQYQKALHLTQSDPWVRYDLFCQSITQMGALGIQHPEHAERLYTSLRQPLPCNIGGRERLASMAQLSEKLPAAAQVEAVDAFGEPFPWDADLLGFRLRAYRNAGDPRFDSAMADIFRFVEQGGELPPPQQAGKQVAQAP